MDILEKIQLPESRKLEFKQSLPTGKKVVQTIVAFANGAGGELLVTIGGKMVLSVTVLAGSNKPYYIKSLGPGKGVFVRIGSSNRLASPDAIIDLHRQKRGIPFSAELDFQYSVEDLEIPTVNSFFETIGHEYVVTESLVKWNIAGRNNGDILPTVTGLVLFGKDCLSHYDYAHQANWF